MDVAFEILVPRGTAFVGMSFETPQFVWQGEAHPQGFPQAEFAGQFVVVKTPTPCHLRQFLPLAMTKLDLDCLSIRGNGLDEYKRCHAEPSKNEHTDALAQLLNCVLSATSLWVVVFEMNCDRIDKWIKCGANEVESIIRESLLISHAGFVAAPK